MILIIGRVLGLVNRNGYQIRDVGFLQPIPTVNRKKQPKVKWSSRRAGAKKKATGLPWPWGLAR
jgi:hypothetical protein